MLCAPRPRTGRGSTGFRSLPQSLHAISDLVIPVGEQMSVGPERHAQIGVAELPLHMSGFAPSAIMRATHV